MSDEPRPEDQSSENTIESEVWEMPKPVFRSTEGYTPGSDIDGAITDEMDVDGTTKTAGKRRAVPPDGEYEMESLITEEMPGYKPDEIATAITEEMPGMDAKKKGGCLKQTMMVGLVLVVLAVAAFAGLYFFLPEYLPTRDPFQ